jgi:hypothetical protein
VELERILESGFELRGCARDVDLDPPERSKLPAAPAMVVPLLRRELRLVDGFPSLRQVEDGRFRTLDQLQAGGPERGYQPAACGQPRELGEILAAGGGALGQRRGGFGACVVADEEVGESGVPAEKREHLEPVGVAEAERQGADERAVLVGDLHGELAAVAVVAPPFDQPGVKQERARARSRPDEAVPVVRETRKAALARDRVERQLGRGGRRSHIEKVPPV